MPSTKKPTAAAAGLSDVEVIRRVNRMSELRVIRDRLRAKQTAMAGQLASIEEQLEAVESELDAVESGQPDLALDHGEKANAT